ncbi:response regulator transcription factor [Photobacterium lutimaris]|uniref:DNA-binding response regulator n=1 Tax=Photobacterium lutimaris TaxID=388278 RepID=A0A2T3J3Q1_9GAMM|nr:response regulator [Photobacterium lutimaris]PSU35873.1 DNA-binding response regulator [Photobacterium lutimaris]TDR78945.1 LuxR family two component transcriptional regulator [Photobacterium lutimaris]
MPCTIYLVDDDAAILDSVCWLLEGEGFDVKTYNSAENFLDSVDIEQPGVILLDINMPGIDGLELQKRLAEKESNFVIVFLTGHASVEITKTAFKRGANDLLQKPVNGEELCCAITQAQDLAISLSSSKQATADLEARVALLTEREKELVPLIIQGKPNKVIADELCIALRTVEIHRHNLFKKMGVTSGIQLAFEGQGILGLLN